MRIYALLAFCTVSQFVSAQQFEVKEVHGRRYEITKVLDELIFDSLKDLIAPYQLRVDSMIGPVLGESVSYMSSYRPESPLSNLLADILRSEAVSVTGKPAQLAVCNIGGIRSALPKGSVTVGDILEIAPFENMYCVVTLRGKKLLELFEQIASVRGEGLSGARLVIDDRGNLLEATVGGKPVDEKALYRVATLDYLAQGNDKLEAFKDASSVETTTLPVRDVYMSYIKEKTRKGEKLDSKIEGRIIIK